MPRITETGRAAEVEPLVTTVEIRRNTGPHDLRCCATDAGHAGGSLLVIVRDKWMGAASCADPSHLADVIRQAIDQARVKLDD